MAWVGAITAIYAALTALTQRDFKRVLAFSTISQLGYMFVGLGVAGSVLGPGPGMFHLFTHAFFKALLFLGAGSVLHALHHATHKEVQDMRKMGGLAKYMPITAITWLIATLAISGFPFFSGFYSKDNIIGLAYQHGYYGLYAVTLTHGRFDRVLYAARLHPGLWRERWRIWWAVGWNLSWRRHAARIAAHHHHPARFAGNRLDLSRATGPASSAIFKPGAPNLDLGAVFTDPLTWIGVVVSLVGLVWAYVLYTRFDLATINAVVEGNAVLRFLHRLTLRKFYLDDIYDWLIRYVVLGISHIEAAFDAYVVDGIVNGVAGAVTGAGRDLRRIETGKVQTYMVGFFGGLAVLAIVVFALVMFVR